MKTFDEAMSATVPLLPLGNNAEELQETIRQTHAALELSKRYSGISEEAQSNEAYRFMSNTLMQHVAACTMRPTTAILTAFMNGLIVGAEMEKHENGGVAADWTVK